jgi:hypothetical protein
MQLPYLISSLYLVLLYVAPYHVNPKLLHSFLLQEQFAFLLLLVTLLLPLLLDVEELLFFKLIVPCELFCQLTSFVYFVQQSLLFVHQVFHSVIYALLFLLSMLQSLYGDV